MLLQTSESCGAMSSATLKRSIAEQIAVVEGAAHFMISTHAEAVATKIAGHIAAFNAMTLENSAYSRHESGVSATRM
jgi:hypothetical protein